MVISSSNLNPSVLPVRQIKLTALIPSCKLSVKQLGLLHRSSSCLLLTHSKIIIAHSSTLHTFNVKTMNQELKFDISGNVSSISTDGSIIAFCSANETSIIFDALSQENPSICSDNLEQILDSFNENHGLQSSSIVISGYKILIAENMVYTGSYNGIITCFDYHFNISWRLNLVNFFFLIESSCRIFQSLQ